MTGSKDIRLTFNAAARAYDEVRPGYPAALFDVLFRALPDQPKIVEVGPGSGQATEDLLARGATVHATEIGPALAAQLRANLPSERLQVSIGDFEEVPLEPASADAVFSATAYHWISPEAQTDRPATILRPGGIIAIVDLIQVESPSDLGFFAAAQPIYDRYGEGHKGPPRPTRGRADPAIRAVLESDERYDHVSVRTYNWDQTYTGAEYRKLMLSYSGTQLLDEVKKVRLLDDIEAFINSDFGGRITRPLVVTLTMGVLLERTVAPGLETSRKNRPRKPS